MTLRELLEVVTAEATFMAFVLALTGDKLSQCQRFRNGSIEEFLEAESSLAEDSDFGLRRGISTASS